MLPACEAKTGGGVLAAQQEHLSAWRATQTDTDTTVSVLSDAINSAHRSEQSTCLEGNNQPYFKVLICVLYAGHCEYSS